MIRITETIFRDAHQSLIATRMRTSDMVPVAKALDQIGYHAMEVWGGATFDASLRFLNEDPWERLRTLRAAMPNTKLQMLLRGQNLLGYRHYPDDVVSAFIQASVRNGIDIIRIFDALNDARNVRLAIHETKEAGAHAQAAISYTKSPVHDIGYYVQKAQEYVNLGADSICIKDMSGILLPYDAYELVSRIKETVQVPLELHSHCSTGMANQSYMKAVEAGVDILDTALSPFANGTSQPPTEAVIAQFVNTPYDSGLDIKPLAEIAEYFEELRSKYVSEGLLNPKVMRTNVSTLINQVPGGMYSNLLSQLGQQQAMHRLEEVLEEVPHVRKDLGYPPLVTPMSQMVATQAVFNVLLGERYKIVPKEIKNYVRGMYGRPPAEISKEIVQKIIGDERQIQVRPADLLEPMMHKIPSEIKKYMEQDEDELTYLLFPQVALEFFQRRETGLYKIDTDLWQMDNEDETYPV